MTFKFIIRSSYGNDSIALIQWVREQRLDNVAVLYNDTGWAERQWANRIDVTECWVHGLGFTPLRTKSVGMEQLVRNKRGWPRQGLQFCTQHLKIEPTINLLREIDPGRTSTGIIGVRREESRNRANFPEWSEQDERKCWAPLVDYTEAMRDELLQRAGIEPLPHRSDECFPCVNSNRADIRRLSVERIKEIAAIEKSLGHTSKGNPRTMFRPYRYMGATGIVEIARWAKSERGQFDLDDGNGSSGCEAGRCGI